MNIDLYTEPPKRPRNLERRFVVVAADGIADTAGINYGRAGPNAFAITVAGCVVIGRIGVANKAVIKGRESAPITQTILSAGEQPGVSEHTVSAVVRGSGTAPNAVAILGARHKTGGSPNASTAVGVLFCGTIEYARAVRIAGNQAGFPPTQAPQTSTTASPPQIPAQSAEHWSSPVLPATHWAHPST